MKAEIELNIDRRGIPCIKIKHYDKDNSVEQNLIKIFIQGASSAGLVVRNPSGYLETGASNSYEIYELQIAEY